MIMLHDVVVVHAEAASVGDSSSSAVLRKRTQQHVPALLPSRKETSKKSRTGKLCFVFL